MSPSSGALLISTEVAAGVALLAPNTFWPAASVIAWAPRPRTAPAPAALRIVPPFSAKASAAMPMPFASKSARCTT